MLHHTRQRSTHTTRPDATCQLRILQTFLSPVSARLDARRSDRPECLPFLKVMHRLCSLCFHEHHRVRNPFALERTAKKVPCRGQRFLSQKEQTHVFLLL